MLTPSFLHYMRKNELYSVQKKPRLYIFSLKEKSKIIGLPSKLIINVWTN